MWGNDHQITAVEFDADIARAYSEFFPNDVVVIADAHEYLINNYNNFDFIWTSPPCQTHSGFRQNICVRYRGSSAVYPDMRLYQEIIFLNANAQCDWVVENVKPYYKPLIEPTATIQRHNFWSNFYIPEKTLKKSNIRKEQIQQLQERHGFDLTGIKIKNKRQVLRNCVEADAGKFILDLVL